MAVYTSCSIDPYTSAGDKEEYTIRLERMVMSKDRLMKHMEQAKDNGYDKLIIQAGNQEFIITV